MKRSRMKPRSQKRVEDAPERAAVVAEVIARDGGCLFFPMLGEYLGMTKNELIHCFGLDVCGGPLTAHEPGHSRNVGRLDVAASICLCFRHNGALEDLTGIIRQHAYACGLLLHANGLPLRHRVDQ